MCYIVQHIWQSWITLTSICDSDKWQCSLNCCHVPSGWDIQATGYTPDHQSHRNALKMYVYRIILLLYYQVQHCFNASSCATIPQLFLLFQWYVLFAWCVNGISSLTQIKNLPSSLTLRVTLLSKYSDVFFSPLSISKWKLKPINFKARNPDSYHSPSVLKWVNKFTSQLCWPQDTIPPPVCCFQIPNRHFHWKEKWAGDKNIASVLMR